MDPNKGRNPSLTHPNPYIATVKKDEFKADIRKALSACYPLKPNAYRRVYVLITSWDNAPEYDGELSELENVFREIYGFEVEHFKLPSNSWSPGTSLITQFGRITETFDASCLIIFYYAGHAEHNYDKTSNPEIYRSFSLVSNSIQKGDSSSYKRKLELNQAFAPLQGPRDEDNEFMRDERQPDILLILDCCYAGSEAILGNFELLAACGIDRVTDGAGHSGSFTLNLVQFLYSYGGRPMTIAQIHAKLVRSFYSGNLTTTPFHVELSERMIGRGSIVLAPLQIGAPTIPPQQRGYSPIVYKIPQPTVLLSISFKDVSAKPDPAQWSNWLVGSLPPGITDVNIEVLGFYRTQSGIMILSMPIEVWNTMKGRKAYVFQGFQIPEPPPSGLSLQDQRKENIPVRGRRPAEEETK